MVDVVEVVKMRIHLVAQRVKRKTHDADQQNVRKQAIHPVVLHEVKRMIVPLDVNQKMTGHLGVHL
jgi:hypothetical protein